MKNPEKKKQSLSRRRRLRIRSKVRGTPDRPRLSVYRSLAHINAQIIDDTTGRTLVSCSDKSVSGDGGKNDGMTRKCAQAYSVGLELAKLAIKANIKRVVFDRGGRKYHGRVKAVADGAREGGLEF